MAFPPFLFSLHLTELVFSSPVHWWLNYLSALLHLHLPEMLHPITDPILSSSIPSPFASHPTRHAKPWPMPRLKSSAEKKLYDSTAQPCLRSPVAPSTLPAIPRLHLCPPATGLPTLGPQILLNTWKAPYTIIPSLHSQHWHSCPNFPREKTEGHTHPWAHL